MDLLCRSCMSKNCALTLGYSSFSIFISQMMQIIDGMKMILVPSGSFMMGSNAGGEFEAPSHRVYINDFWMDSTPVTNQQYLRFVEESGYITEAEVIGHAWGYENEEYCLIPGLSWRKYCVSGREDHPVVLITWNDAQAYAKWAGKRLPTEAEWEKAAQSGSTEPLYPWGNQTPDGTQCNFARNPEDFPPTTSVWQFPPNNYGLYDMVGNVWQWCSDYYSERYYSTSPMQNPIGPNHGELRVRRGGSWNVIQPFRLRTANRGAVPATLAAPNLGFRCCHS